MPPALTGSMLSHAAQAASFNKGMEPTRRSARLMPGVGLLSHPYG